MSSVEEVTNHSLHDFLSNQFNLVGGLEHEFYFSIQLRMSSSQLLLTPSFFSVVAQPPSRLYINHSINHPIILIYPHINPI